MGSAMQTLVEDDAKAAAEAASAKQKLAAEREALLRQQRAAVLAAQASRAVTTSDQEAGSAAGHCTACVPSAEPPRQGEPQPTAKRHLNTTVIVTQKVAVLVDIGAVLEPSTKILLL